MRMIFSRIFLIFIFCILICNGCVFASNIIDTRKNINSPINPIQDNNDTKLFNYENNVESSNDPYEYVYRVDMQKQNIIYEYRDDDDKKKLVNIDFNIPIFDSKNKNKANIVNYLMQNTGFKLIAQYAKDFACENVKRGKCTVSFVDIYTTNNYLYNIPFFFNEYPLCKIFINTSDNSCFAN